jgi:hypothetical protein
VWGDNLYTISIFKYFVLQEAEKYEVLDEAQKGLIGVIFFSRDRQKTWKLMEMV